MYAMSCSHLHQVEHGQAIYNDEVGSHCFSALLDNFYRYLHSIGIGSAPVVRYMG